MSYAIVAMLGLWLLVSLANQGKRTRVRMLRAFGARINRYDPFMAVPDFPFFAPVPPTLDTELLYRDRLFDGELSPWRAIPRRSVPVIKSVWNPDKRYRAALERFSGELLRLATCHAGDDVTRPQIFASEPYVSLAEHVTRAPHGVLTTETQFMIALSAGFDETKKPAVAFVSPFFRLC